MVTILSYPRSGNHFVRYIVEFLTGRATIGASGFTKAHGQDTPICLRQGTQFLTHVSLDEPVANKHHWPEKINTTPDKLVVILRNPAEAILSHRVQKFNKLNTLELKVASKDLDEFRGDAKKFISILDYYDSFEGDKQIVLYEDLVGEDYAKSIEALGEIFDFDEGRLSDLTSDFKKYRIDSMRSPTRSPISSKNKAKSKEFYTAKLQSNNPANLEAYMSAIADVLNHKIIKETYA